MRRVLQKASSWAKLATSLVTSLRCLTSASPNPGASTTKAGRRLASKTGAGHGLNRSCPVRPSLP
eukprot:4041346-Prymnesium_polylepis.1